MLKNKKYTVLMEWSNSIVVQDPDNPKECYQIFHFKKKPDPRNDCREVCPHKQEDLRRPLLGTKHFACLTKLCRIRRAYKAQMPLIIPVFIYTCVVRKDRRFAAAKALLLHKLANILEWLAN